MPTEKNEPRFSVEEMPGGGLIVLENAADLDLRTSAQAWITRLADTRTTFMFPEERFEKTELSYEPRKNPGILAEPAVLKAVIFSRK